MSVNTVRADAGQPLAPAPPALPLPNPSERLRLSNPSQGVVRVEWEPLPPGTLVELWLLRTKPSRKAYPSKFRHLAYADGTTGFFDLFGIPAGTRVAVKGRTIRTDGGRSFYTQVEIVI